MESMDLAKRIERAIYLLALEGYETQPNMGESTIFVQDPVRCSRGSMVWVEYKTVSISVHENLRHVRRFIMERS